MSNIDKHGLLGVPKHANQHRLSRLTMEVHTDELRIMASAVESYTDELIAALEAAEKRIAEQAAIIAKQEQWIKDIEATMIAATDRAEAAEKRIAELEAREVVLPKAISVLHRRDFIDAHRAIYAYPEAEVNAALAAAGITVKGDSE